MRIRALLTILVALCFGCPNGDGPGQGDACCEMNGQANPGTDGFPSAPQTALTGSQASAQLATGEVLVELFVYDDYASESFNRIKVAETITSAADNYFYTLQVPDGNQGINRTIVRATDDQGRTGRLIPSGTLSEVQCMLVPPVDRESTLEAIAEESALTYYLNNKATLPYQKPPSRELLRLGVGNVGLSPPNTIPTGQGEALGESEAVNQAGLYAGLDVFWTDVASPNAFDDDWENGIKLDALEVLAAADAGASVLGQPVGNGAKHAFDVKLRQRIDDLPDANGTVAGWFASCGAVQFEQVRALISAFNNVPPGLTALGVEKRYAELSLDLIRVHRRAWESVGNSSIIPHLTALLEADGLELGATGDPPSPPVFLDVAENTFEQIIAAPTDGATQAAWLQYRLDAATFMNVWLENTQLSATIWTNVAESVPGNSPAEAAVVALHAKLAAPPLDAAAIAADVRRIRVLSATDFDGYRGGGGGSFNLNSEGPEVLSCAAMFTMANAPF